MEGLRMVPTVAEPMAKATRPAAVAAPGRALMPLEPSSRSQGFMVWPPNQMSLRARAPRLNFAPRTAPAALRRAVTGASGVGRRWWDGPATYAGGRVDVVVRSSPHPVYPLHLSAS